MPSEISDPLTRQATERALLEILSLIPEDPVALTQYARFLAIHHRRDEAAAYYRRALANDPDLLDSLRGLAALLISQRDFAEALPLLQHAVSFNTNDVPALCDLGNLLVLLHRGTEAIPHLQHALAVAPNDHRLHSNLGLAFTDAGLFDDAHHAFQHALQLSPASAAAHVNLGNLLLLTNQLDDARAAFDRAESLDPNNLNAPCNRALVFLTQGEYLRGWRDYQLRWQRSESPHRPYPQPLWTGQPLHGKTILLHTDEGLGDRIQFIRYARLLKSCGAHVIVETPMPLMEVFRTAPGIDQLIQLGDPLPFFDYHAPLLTLPHRFNTTLDTIPSIFPYLAADPARVAFWREYLQQNTRSTDFVVGIAWQGNPHHQHDRFRSLPLAHLEPLARLPNVRLLSLQRGPGIDQIPSFQTLTHGKLLVPTAGTQSSPSDLADSAALIAVVPLILTVDTASAHLAAALARPTWTLLSAVTDWRWLTHRQDTPWYPSMRLWRQSQRDDWPELISRVATALLKVSKPP